MKYCADKRLEILQKIWNHEVVAAGCKAEGISTATYYRWNKRYKDNGLLGLDELNRKPHKSPNAISSKYRAQVIRLAKSKKYRSANAIAVEMKKRGRPVSRNTVIKILTSDYHYPIYYRMPTGEWRFWDTVRKVRIAP